MSVVLYSRPALGCTGIGGEVFDGCGDGVWSGQAVALIAANIGPSDGGAKVGIFTCALGAATPSGIARDVDHGVSRNQLDAGGAGLNGGHVREVSDKSGIPTGKRWHERHWEDSAEAVDDVGAEEQAVYGGAYCRQRRAGNGW